MSAHIDTCHYENAPKNKTKADPMFFSYLARLHKVILYLIHRTRVTDQARDLIVGRHLGK
jgi:hypothetical protein